MRRRDKYVIAKCVVRSLIYQFKIFILTAICFDVLGTRKCQNFKFLTKSRFTTNRTCYTLLNLRKNPTGGVSIEMAEPISQKFVRHQESVSAILDHHRKVIPSSYSRERKR
jgi:hypothetical protein